MVLQRYVLMYIFCLCFTTYTHLHLNAFIVFYKYLIQRVMIQLDIQVSLFFFILIGWPSVIAPFPITLVNTNKRLQSDNTCYRGYFARIWIQVCLEILACPLVCLGHKKFENHCLTQMRVMAKCAILTSLVWVLWEQWFQVVEKSEMGYIQ